MKKMLFAVAAFVLIVVPLCSAKEEQTNTFSEAKQLYDKGEYQQAIPLFKKVIKGNPKKEDEALYFLGMCQLKLLNYQASVENFSKALKIREDNYIQAIRGRSEAYLALKNYDLALLDLQKLLQSSPNDIDLSYQIGVVYYNKNNFIEAENYLKKVVDARPQDPQAHYHMGFVYYRLKKYDLTIKHFEIYVKLCPDCPEAEKIKEIIRSLKG